MGFGAIVARLKHGLSGEPALIPPNPMILPSMILSLPIRCPPRRSMKPAPGRRRVAASGSHTTDIPLQTPHLRLAENLPNSITLGEVLPSPLIRSHGQVRFQVTLRSLRARPLTNHVQQILSKTPLPEDVTVVFDMDALNFS